MCIVCVSVCTRWERGVNFGCSSQFAEIARYCESGCGESRFGDLTLDFWNFRSGKGSTSGLRCLTFTIGGEYGFACTRVSIGRI